MIGIPGRSGAKADTDTIAAVATPAGFGGIGIIRLSGPGVPEMAQGIVGCLPAPRRAERARFRDASGQMLDDGIVIFFPAPASYTGEHVLELQGHGGPVVLDMLLERCLALGARVAEPGEFSRRAFLNGKLDLAQAEAVADLIASQSAAAARAAIRSLTGAFSRRTAALASAISELRAYVEAGLDFPDEELDLLASPEVEARLEQVLADLDGVLAKAGQGRALTEGMTVVIAGRPNAGKSSLLNRLAGEETAIVTEVPGTTRDLLRTQILIDGMPLHIVDTAGLREADDRVEIEGIRRARLALSSADRVLLVEDAGERAADLPDLPPIAVTRIRNKIDLTGEQAGVDETAQPPVVRLSALTGEGIHLLRRHLRQAMGYGGEGGTFAARRRHLEALAQARTHLTKAKDQLSAHRAELVAEELRLARGSLDQISGRQTTEELLGEIFSRFCIGK